MSQKIKKISFNNEVWTIYQITELKAGIIIMDYIKNEVYAGRSKVPLEITSKTAFF